MAKVGSDLWYAAAKAQFSAHDSRVRGVPQVVTNSPPRVPHEDFDSAGADGVRAHEADVAPGVGTNSYTARHALRVRGQARLPRTGPRFKAWVVGTAAEAALFRCYSGGGDTVTPKPGRGAIAINMPPRLKQRVFCRVFASLWRRLTCPPSQTYTALLQIRIVALLTLTGVAAVVVRPWNPALIAFGGARGPHGGITRLAHCCRLTCLRYVALQGRHEYPRDGRKTGEEDVDR